ncbi:MAG: hypothetical protein Tsb002_14720 [Wenzhouxiangellaceae bacterium]
MLGPLLLQITPLLASEAVTGIQLQQVIDTGKAPHQITFSPQGDVAYIAAAGSDRIDVIDSATLTWRSAFHAPGVPLGIAVADSGAMLVSQFHGDRLLRFNRWGQAEGDISVAAGPSLLIAAPGLDEASQQWLVSSEQSHQLSLIGANPWRVLRTFSTGQRPFPPLFDENEQRLLVPDYAAGTITVFAVNNRDEPRTVAVGQQPSGVARLPDGRYAVVLRGEQRIAILDAELREAAEIRAGIGKLPFSMVVDPLRNWAYVNNSGSHDISVIDLSTLRVLQRIRTGEIPIVMALQSDGTRLWVACEGSDSVHVLRLPPLAGDPLIGNNSDPQPSTSAMSEPVIAEIRQLHYFFQEWFSGRLPQDETAFSRFSRALDEGMQFIATDGRQLDRDTLQQGLWQAHAQDRDIPLRIWTENEQVSALADDRWLAIYDEHQRRDQQYTIRRSTALFTQSADGSLRWRHVHETWLQPPSDQD